MGVVVAVAIIGGIIYYSQSRMRGSGDEETALEELDALIDAGTGIPDIQTPSVNPLDKVEPSGNPIEKANPFTNEYKNPFE